MKKPLICLLLAITCIYPGCSSPPSPPHAVIIEDVIPAKKDAPKPAPPRTTVHVPATSLLTPPKHEPPVVNPAPPDHKVKPPRIITIPADTDKVSQPVNPSDDDQVIEWKENVTVLIPGGLLEKKRKLTMSRTKKKLPHVPSQMKPLASYDISLGDLHHLPKAIDIQFKHKPVKDTDSIVCAYWDPTRSAWVTLASASSPEGYTRAQTRHLTLMTVIQFVWNEFALKTPHFKIYYDAVKIDTKDKKTGKVTSVVTNRVPKSSNLQSKVGATSNAAYIATATDIAGYLEESYTAYAKAAFKMPTVDQTPFKPISATNAPFETLDTKIKTLACTPVYVMTNGNYWLSSSKFIALDRNLSKETLNFTAAHELFHAIQSEYEDVQYAPMSTWWTEATAECASLRVAKRPMDRHGMSINPSYLEAPLDYYIEDSELKKTKKHGLHEYQTGYFVDFMTEQNPKIFKQFWDYLADYGYTAKGLERFAAWSEEKQKTTLAETYRAFAPWLVLNANSPSSIKADTMKTKVMPANSMVHLVKTSVTSYYAGFVQAVKVRMAPGKKSDALVVVTSPIPSDLFVDVYKLETGKLFSDPNSNLAIPKPIASFNHNKSDKTLVSVAPNETLYLVAINAGDFYEEVAMGLHRINPQLSISPPDIKEGVTGQSYTFKASLTGVPKGFVAAEVEFQWKFGDGRAMLKKNLSDLTVSHSYAKPGKYEVTVSAHLSGSGDLIGSASANVEIAKPVFDESFPRRYEGTCDFFISRKAHSGGKDSEEYKEKNARMQAVMKEDGTWTGTVFPKKMLHNVPSKDGVFAGLIYVIESRKYEKNIKQPAQVTIQARHNHKTGKLSENPFSAGRVKLGNKITVTGKYDTETLKGKYDATEILLTGGSGPKENSWYLKPALTTQTKVDFNLKRVKEAQGKR